MEILVTGAAGRIGTHLIEDLGSDFHITAASGHLPDFSDKSGVTPYELDITDGHQLNKLFIDKQFDTIVHLAAVSGAACESEADRAVEVNTVASSRLGELAIEHGVGRFVNISTSYVYHQKRPEPTREEDNIDPHTVYGSTKLAAEQSLEALAAESEDTNFISLRPFNVYGEGFDRSLVMRLMTSEPVTLFRNFYRDYVHIGDVVGAIKSAVTTEKVTPKAHLAINIGSGILRSVEDVLETVESRGWQPNAHWSDAEDKAKYTCADITRAQDLLGFIPVTDLIIPKR